MWPYLERARDWKITSYIVCNSINNKLILKIAPNDSKAMAESTLYIFDQNILNNWAEFTDSLVSFLNAFLSEFSERLSDSLLKTVGGSEISKY